MVRYADYPRFLQAVRTSWVMQASMCLKRGSTFWWLDSRTPCIPRVTTSREQAVLRDSASKPDKSEK